MKYEECHCPRCHKLLAKLRLLDPGRPSLEAWCPRCRRLVIVTVERTRAA